MVQGNAAAAWDRAAIDEAKRLCDALIAQVQGVLVGESSFSGEFLFVFIDTAEELLRLLEARATPLSDKLKYFRDYVATWSEDYPGQRTGEFFKPYSGLGLPVYEGDGIPSDIVAGLTGEWLALMREFRSEIAAIQPYSKRRMRQSKGGRRTAQKTKQLHKDIADWLAQEASSLKKNGASDAFIRERQMRFTWRDIVNGINDSCLTRQYKLDEATRRKVQRSPSWKALHGTASPAAFGEEPTEDSPMYRASDAFDLGRAVEERLRPQRAEAVRTKFPAR